MCPQYVSPCVLEKVLQRERDKELALDYEDLRSFPENGGSPLLL